MTTQSVNFRLKAPSEALRRIPPSTMNTVSVRDVYVSKPQRTASPGFNASGSITLKQSLYYPEPPASWFNQGSNHGKVGIYTWARDLERVEFYIEFFDLQVFLLFLIEFEARLDVTVDPPTITIPKNWRSDMEDFDDDDYQYEDQ